MSLLNFYCVSCKQIIPEDALTCPYCGADQRNPAILAKDPTSNITLRLPNAQNIHKKRALSLSIAAVFLLSLIAGLSLHLRNGGPIPNNVSPPNINPGYNPSTNAPIPANPRYQYSMIPSPPVPSSPPAPQPTPSAYGSTPQAGNVIPPQKNSIPSDLPAPAPDLGTVKILDASMGFAGNDLSGETVAVGRVDIINTTNHMVVSVEMILGNSFGPVLEPYQGTVDDPDPIFDTSIPPHSVVSFPVMTTGEFSGEVYGPHTISMEADMDDGDIIDDSIIVD